MPLSLLVVQYDAVQALKLPLTRRSTSAGRSFGVSYKGNTSGFNESVGDITFSGHSEDIAYSTAITLGGEEFVVQLDTGSSDLWVYAPDRQPQLTNHSNVFVDLTYGSGSDAGFVDFADVEIGPYFIHGQAFLNVANSTGDETFFAGGMNGILGVSFEGLSQVATQVALAGGNTLGKSVLSNIFQQNVTGPNFISFLLGRRDDLDNTGNGLFTICEYADGYEKVSETPKLPVILPQTPDESPRWQVLIDGLKVNGRSFAFDSYTKAGKSTPKDKALALLDTGTSLAYTTKPLLDFLYADIPSAVYQEGDSNYRLPCMASANVTFIFGGQEINLHPLDYTYSITSDSDSAQCYSTFAVGSQRLLGDLDILLGDAFLKNVYSVFNLGDYINTSDVADSLKLGDPFVQLLPTIANMEEALEDFQRTRSELLKKWPEATSQNEAQPSGNVDERLSKAAATSSDNSSLGWPALSDKLDKYGPVVLGLLAGNLLLGVILCGIGIVFCVRMGARQGGQARTVNPSYSPVPLHKEEGGGGGDFSTRYSD